MTNLFRSEAVAAQSSHLLGSIRIATPPRLMGVALMALSLVAALITFAALGQATRKARIGGVLLPPGGLLQVAAPQSARLQAVQVREGDAVEAGQVLAVLHLGSHSDKGDTAALLDQSLRARMDALQAERAACRHRPSSGCARYESGCTACSRTSRRPKASWKRCKAA